MQNAIVEKIIDLSALKHNLEIVRKKAPNSTIMAVLKADAYGHGMEELSMPALEYGANFLGVATNGEAIKLRKYLDKNGVARPDYNTIPNAEKPRIMCWMYTDETDLKETIKSNIDLSISSVEQLDLINETLKVLNEKVADPNLFYKAYVHLKIDTGMSRAGARIEDFEELVSKTKGQKDIIIVGVWSHLACADDLESDCTQKQVEIFEKAIALCEKHGLDIQYKHLAASSGILFHPKTHYDMVRAGIMMYGLTPNVETATSQELDLKPLMSVETSVIQIKKFVAGTKISYGGTAVLEKDSHIAVIPIGYADGIPRILSNKMEVEILGKKYRQLGRVCMDQFMVDLEDNIDNISVGDKVKIIGEFVTADDLAVKAQTINYEIVTKMNGRIKTIYVNKDL